MELGEAVITTGFVAKMELLAELHELNRIIKLEINTRFSRVKKFTLDILDLDIDFSVIPLQLCGWNVYVGRFDHGRGFSCCNPKHLGKWKTSKNEIRGKKGNTKSKH